MDGCLLALPSLPSALPASLSHPSVRAGERVRERKRDRKRGRQGTGLPYLALPFLALPACPSLSPSLSVFPPSLPERARNDEGRARVDGCRPALPSLAFALLASPFHCSLKEKKSHRERDRERERGRQGRGWPCRALPCPSSLPFSAFLSFRAKNSRGREGLEWMAVALPCPLCPLP